VPATCPCGSATSYDTCCGPLHRGEVTAPTAERLMRSRYSAFALRDKEYLLATWHPSTRPRTLSLDPDIRWLRLEIIGHTGGGLLVNRGTVEFRAHFRAGGAGGNLHENSSFVRQGGRWFYLGAV
jgi:SEC-C motif-containing protein